MGCSVLDETWPNGNKGTIYNPRFVKSIRSITSEENLISGSVVSYTAGKKILLQDGFKSNGIFFRASIELPPYCDDWGENDRIENGKESYVESPKTDYGL